MEGKASGGRYEGIMGFNLVRHSLERPDGGIVGVRVGATN
ncbi:hypothetical protein LINPERPRIM_LOCUS39796 [Linum perenne]